MREVGSLSPMQRAFAEWYVQLGVAKSAAELAGYGPEYARTKAFDLVNHPGVAAEMERLRVAASAASPVVVEVADIMAGLYKEATDALSSAAARVAAWKALALMVPGAMAPKRSEHTGAGGAPLVPTGDGLSDAVVDQIKQRVLGITPVVH